MPNLIPSVQVELDGTPRKLYFDINAHVAFEEELGQTLIDAMQSISGELRAAEVEGRAPRMPSIRMIRTLLWAGLRSETLDRDGKETERTLSAHQIGAMLDFGSMVDYLRSVGEAFAKGLDGLPESSRNPQKTPRQKRSRSTGSSSGVSPTNGALIATSISG